MSNPLLDQQNIGTTSCRYGTMSYLKSDLIIGQALREYGEWAQGEINFLLDLIDVGDTIVDAGAFIGTNTLAFARHVGPGGQVYAFEPHPIAFELLKLNIEQNELPNVKPFKVALSDTKGNLHIPEAVLNEMDNPEQLSLPIGSEVASTNTDSVDIELASLDQYKMDRCDLIKIDVEGMELNVLKGSAKTLRRLRPIVFAECLSLHNGWQIVLFMRDNGFEAFLHNELSYNPDNFKKNTNNFPGAARETNIVFIPANRLSAFQERCKHFGSLIPLRTLDDLALGMLKKPQYKYQVLAPTIAAQILGIDFLANEPELRQLADTASRVPPLDASLQEKVAHITGLETSLQEKVAHITGLETSLQEKVNHIAELETSLQEKVAQIQQIQHSIPMQLVNRYQRFIERLLRSGTRRRYYYELMLSGIRVILNEGWRAFWYKFRQKYRQKHD